MKFQVRVEGHKELRKAIRDTKDKGLARGLRQAHKETAALVVPPARADAPKQSGSLAASVAPSSSVNGAVVRAGSAKGRTKFYAGPIHFGWPRRGIKPHAFLFRAAYAMREQYATRFRELISALMRDNIES
ncbi:hypothetical protein [Actinosynnema sp. NPDC020468]|uniref:hypothetical protein n=1 Tax=Actinosynnema sp. NPDC020468 TaxID=3154488 RepID=UPI0033CAAD97